MTKYSVLLVIFTIICILNLHHAYGNRFISMNEMDLRDSFGNFIIEHKKDYSSTEEYEIRFQIFKTNMHRVNQYNAQSKTATFGITFFSDLTDDERSKYLGFAHPTPAEKMKRSKPAQTIPSSTVDPKDIPAFDYKKAGLIWPSQDQQDCGSCAYFSVAGAYASAAAFKGYKEPFDLSPQHILDCTPYPSSGCAGSRPELIYDYLTDMSVKGLMTETSYPYKALTNTCKYNESGVNTPFNTMRWVIPPCDDDQDCSRQDGPAALQKIYNNGFSASVCLNANGWFDYTGGVFDLLCHDDFMFVNHCVLFQGFDPNESFVSLSNSWNVKWGENGSIRLKLDFNDEDFKNTCGVFNYLSTIVLPDPK